MQAGRFTKPILIGALALAVSSCEETGAFSSSGDGFRSQYEAARNALEAGNYAKANRTYARLLEGAGPLQPRIRLEYAHSLLRAGEFGDASAQARFLADRQEGETRAAALSVYGTAQHELGLAAIDRGDATAARTHLKSATTAMSEVVRKHPELDPLGALAGRLASIKVQLKSLG